MDKLVSSKKINGALVISAGQYGGVPLAGNHMLFHPVIKIQSS